MIRILKHIKRKLFKSNKVAIQGKYSCHKSASMYHCNISVTQNASLTIADNVNMQHVNIIVESGHVHIGAHCVMHGTVNQPLQICVNGKLDIGHHNLIYANISVRFGGVCAIGMYNGIMQQTEIRCDQNVTIGNFNMISYDCMIYDTNTHNQLSVAQRQKQTINDYPWIGKEYNKPITAPVNIGSNCWLGKRCVVLKGVSISDEATVAAQAVVTKNIPKGALAYGNPAVFKLIEVT
jgi:acetyltransferase-like isoleucine patch superfamily enzyme